MRGFLRWAAAEGLADAGLLDLLTAPIPVTRALGVVSERSAVEAVLAVIPRQADRDQLMFGLLARLGLRPGEVLGLGVGDFDEAGGTLEVAGWGGARRRGPRVGRAQPARPARRPAYRPDPRRPECGRRCAGPARREQRPGCQRASGTRVGSKRTVTVSQSRRAQRAGLGWSFRSFLAGQSVNGLGTMVATVALPLVAVERLHATVFDVGILEAVEWVPAMTIGLPVGALIDRHQHQARVIMMGANLGQAAAVAAVPVSAATGVLTLAVLLAAAFTAGLFGTFFQTGYSPYLRQLVAPDDLATASARLRAGQSALPGQGSTRAPADSNRDRQRRAVPAHQPPPAHGRSRLRCRQPVPHRHRGSRDRLSRAQRRGRSRIDRYRPLM